MRLDKFLQATRLVKKRVFTRELCEESRIEHNGNPAKPGRRIAPGDIVTIRFPRRLLVLKVAQVPWGNISSKEAHLFYEVLEDRPMEDDLLPETV